MPDHRDVADRAFDASRLPSPPRTGAQVFAYLERLLGMLPPEEHAGYVKAPANGENVIALPRDGTIVRTARVVYPDGQIYKVMNDVPNGSPQWQPEDVRPDLYVPFTGAFLPPAPDVADPPVDPPGLEGKVDALHKEVVKQLGLQNDLQAKQDERIRLVEARVLKLENEPPPLVTPTSFWWPF